VATRRTKKSLETTETLQDVQTGKLRKLKSLTKAVSKEQPLLHGIECLCGNEIVVFSLLSNKSDDEENEDFELQPSFIQCDECGLYHKVVEICEAFAMKKLPFGEKLWLFDESEMPDVLSMALDSYDICQAKKAYMTWCVKNGKFDASITLFADVQPDGQIKGRTCSFSPEGRVKIAPFVTRMVVMPELDD
jgi:hypothetical protein